MYKYIIHKLNKKIKHVKPVHEIGVKSMSQAARKLEILDKVLSLFWYAYRCLSNSGYGHTGRYNNRHPSNCIFYEVTNE